MNTTLCIIDVQPKFCAAEKVIDSVVHQVYLAKRRSDGIILVEYGSKSPSYEKIYKALYNYKRFSVVYKNQDDGSREVIKSVRDSRYSTSIVRVCGVNGCACVGDTVRGLLNAKIFGRLEIATNAISCTCTSNPKCWQQWGFQYDISLR